MPGGLHGLCMLVFNAKAVFISTPASSCSCVTASKCSFCVLFWEHQSVCLLSATSFQAYPCSVVSFCSFVPSVAGSTPEAVCVCVCICVCEPVFPFSQENYNMFSTKLGQAA